MILTLMLTKSVQVFFYQAQEEDVSRVHPLRVEFNVWIPLLPQSKIPGSAHGK